MRGRARIRRLFQRQPCDHEFLLARSVGPIGQQAFPLRFVSGNCLPDIAVEATDVGKEGVHQRYRVARWLMLQATAR